MDNDTANRTPRTKNMDDKIICLNSNAGNEVDDHLFEAPAYEEYDYLEGGDKTDQSEVRSVVT